MGYPEACNGLGVQQGQQDSHSQDKNLDAKRECDRNRPPCASGIPHEYLIEHDRLPGLKSFFEDRARGFEEFDTRWQTVVPSHVAAHSIWTCLLAPRSNKTSCPQTPAKNCAARSGGAVRHMKTMPGGRGCAPRVSRPMSSITNPSSGFVIPGAS